MTFLILVGGSSTRMGQDKASLQFSGKTLLEILINRLQPHGNIVVVARKNQSLPASDAKVVYDSRPGCGPLAGLHAGLSHSSDNINILLGCDFPLASPGVCKILASNISDVDACVPIVDGFCQPLYAAYSKSCLPEVERTLKSRDLRMIGLLERLNTRKITMDELQSLGGDTLSFFNMNTLKDFHFAQRLLQADV